MWGAKRIQNLCRIEQKDDELIVGRTRARATKLPGLQDRAYEGNE